MREIQERFVFPDGIKGEWEPTGKYLEEKEARQIIRQKNKDLKKSGSYMQLRTVPTVD